MCPLRYLISLLLCLFTFAVNAKFQAMFEPAKIDVLMTEVSGKVDLTITGLTSEIMDPSNVNDRNYVQIKSRNADLAAINNPNEVNFLQISENGTFAAHFNVSGIFLGSTELFVEIKTKAGAVEQSDDTLEVIVTRKKRAIDHIFTGSVIVLVSIVYINFGAATDLTVIKDILRRPIGPTICFICQFLFMPLASFGLGHLLFADAPEMALVRFHHNFKMLHYNSIHLF